jgi:uncharacterized damage-inducible protein DinB
MDRDALRELFDYTTFTWASYGNSVRALPAGAFTEAVGGSGWPALRDALFHIATAWDEWVCEQTGVAFEPRERDTVTTWEELDAVRTPLRASLRGIIDDTPDDRMSATVPGIPGGPGRAPGDVIAHILLHERGHHGDVTTLLSALGAEPPLMDYLVYVFFRDREK